MTSKQGYFDMFDDADLNDIRHAITALVYRMATYATNNLLDDPALLALIFC